VTPCEDSIHVERCERGLQFGEHERLSVGLGLV
jgi:hypothetical protein